MLHAHPGRCAPSAPPERKLASRRRRAAPALQCVLFLLLADRGVSAVLDVLAADDRVADVRVHLVVAGAAVDRVAGIVRRLDRVVARTGPDHVVVLAAVDAVVAGATPDE